LKFLVSIFALIILVPPAQAHVDVIAFDAIELHADEDNYNEAHQANHHGHEDDTENDTEHHHHCTMLGITYAIINSTNSYYLFFNTEQKQVIVSYDNLHENSYLNSLFQPPQIA